MRHSSPTYELDRLISDAQEAQAGLRALIEGITPDDHGVVTSTAEDAAGRADEYHAAIVGFEERALAVASTIDDFHPQTSGAFDQFTMLSRRTHSRLNRSSVGHTDGELAAVEDEETASVAVEITSADDDGSGPSFYGV